MSPHRLLARKMASSLRSRFGRVVSRVNIVLYFYSGKGIRLRAEIQADGASKGIDSAISRIDSAFTAMGDTRGVEFWMNSTPPQNSSRAKRKCVRDDA